MKKLVLFLLIIILFSNFISASLGISPATVEINFVPEAEHILRFSITTDNPTGELEIFLDGDFKEYASLSKTKLVGSGIIELEIKFPGAVDKPGIHKIMIGAKSSSSGEGVFGTVIDVRVPINIFVPYPGRYIEGRLNLPDGNVGEKIPVELQVINRGKEDLIVNIYIDFVEETGEVINRMTFEQAQITTTAEKYFREYLNTSDFRPGNYLARAIIDYGEITEINRTFRIGSLFVEIVNFTEELPKGGIKRYHIDIESKWNNNLGEVFADVNLSKDSESIVFRTPSVELEAWGKETLEGFLDTEDLEGEYSVTITLHYKDQKNSVSGVLLIKRSNFNMIIWFSLSVILLLMVIFILLRRKKSILTNKSKKKDEKK